MKTIKFITRLFLFSILLFPLTVQADSSADVVIQQAHQKHLANTVYWKRLLHVHKGFLWGEKSDIDGSMFFLSKHGRKNSREELDATLRSFFVAVSTDPEQEHPQCRFPARFDWLNEQLYFPADMPHVACERFDSWREKLNAEGVSIVFASYYMNNPSSMYGHTFLRLKRKGKDDADRLLDYTVNFSANTNATNGLAFAVLGLAGGYPGTFSTLPYYAKTQKYNNMESRDLWEYQLNFTPEQIDRLVKHVWELGHTSISYYFLNKNCSYQLLPVLEVGNPELHLSDRFSTRAIPLDTLRVILNAPNLLVNHRVRASHLQQMRAIRSQLSSEEHAFVQKIVDEKSIYDVEEITQRPADRQLPVLEATQQYLRYRYGFKRPQPDDFVNFERKILLLRSQLPISNFETLISSYSARLAAPESAHGTAKFILGVGSTRSGSFEEFSWHPALHDMNSDATGFIPSSTLEMFSPRIRLNNQSGKAYLEEGTLIHVRSLSAWETWVHKPSWAIQADFSTAHEMERAPQDTIHFNVGGGSGFTFAIPRLDQSIFYSMMDVDSGVGGIFNDHYRAGVGGTVGTLFVAGHVSRTHVMASFMRYGVGDINSVNMLSLIQSFSISKNIEVRLSAERNNHYEESSLAFHLFY